MFPLRQIIFSACLALTSLSWAQPATTTADAPPPYKDPNLPFDKRVADLVSRMTLEEKAAQIHIFVPANQRLGIPAWNWWSEAIHGISRAGPSTVYPHAIALSAMWDPPLLQKIASATADESRAKFDPGGSRYYGLTLWCPAVNLTRDPRWGRIQESYGEDPHLVSRLGVAFVKGLQGDHPKYLKTVATPKHFAMHSQETGRTNTSFDISERTLREYYLPAFYACFVEGQAASTMAAHSGINKVPCTANPWLFNDLLRGEWGFQGAVVTDWTAVTMLRNGHKIAPELDEAAAAAIKGGIDVFSEEKPTQGWILQAVQKKLITEEDLNKAVSRNLLLRFRLGVFDPPEMVPYTKIPKSVVGCKENLNLALQSARESIVLLQNNPAPPGYGFDRLLPIDLRKVNSIAVLGTYAGRIQLGNYSGQPANPPVSPLGGIASAVGDRVRINTASWQDEEESVKAAKNSDIVIVVMGLSEKMEAEGFDRKTLDLPLNQAQFLEKIVAANPLTILVLEGGGPIGLTWAKEHVPAIMTIWYPGEQGGNALADVLFGQYNPAGRLPITYYRHVDDLPPLNDYEIDKGRTYMYLEKPACFVFGHGLSYSEFTYSKPEIKRVNDAISVTCDVTNTSTRDGDEVVQVYVHQDKSIVKRPIRQLRAFERVNIAAGKTRSVKLSIPVKDLAYWDEKTHKFIVEPSTYEIQIGASSADIRLKGTVDIK